MANTCCYEMKVVGRTKKSLVRLINILSYRDDKFCLSRVYTVSYHCDKIQKDGLWSVELFGTCAWSTESWFIPDNKNKNHMYTYGKHFKDYTGPVYSVFSDICRDLDIGVEVYSCDEIGGIQEHNLTNHLGRTVIHMVDYISDFESVSKGGYKKYGEFLDNKSIY